MNDLRFAFRQLLKNPGFTLGVVVSLALGIGGNTGIFTIANSVLFRPIPGVEDPASLVGIFQTSADYPGSYSRMSYPDYRDLRDQSSVYSGLAAHGLDSMALTGPGGLLERIAVEVTTSDFFRVLGVKPALGRTFQAAEDGEDRESHVVVLSYSLWQTRLGGRTNILGEGVRLNGRSCTIIGVASKDFSGMMLGRQAEAWVPISALSDVNPSKGARLKARDTRWLQVVGRLKPGAAIKEAGAECEVIGVRLAQAHPVTNENLSFIPVSMEHSGVHPELRLPAMGVLGFLMGIVGLALLIACVNVANLMLGRAVGRRKEMAIRLSLGSTRLCLVRHIMVECVVIALAGGGLGVWVAWWISRFVTAFRVPGFGVLGLDLRLDYRVLAFTLVLSLATALVFGLIPSLKTTRISPVQAMTNFAPMVKLSRRRFRLKNLYIISQVSLSMILLILGGILLRSLRAAHSADPGFNPEDVLLVSLDFGQQGYTPDRTAAFSVRLRERMLAQPGVEAASWASAVPLGSKTLQTSAISEDQWSDGRNPGVQVFCNAVDPGYFGLMEIAVRQGRSFTGKDDASSQPVVVVSEYTAQHFWPGENPIGKRLRLGGADTFLEVIGVVENTKAQDVREQPQLQAFQPLAQQPQDALVLHVRARGVEGLAQTIPALIGELDSQLPVHDIETLPQHLNRSLFLYRISTSLALGFATLALLLAGVGIYGVVSQGVSQRTHEIGIRIAVGADRRQILLMVLSEGARLTGLGIVLGLIPAIAITKLLSGFLIQVHFLDPVSYVGVWLLLMGVALVATLAPALRAMRIEPIQALRYE